MGADTSRRSTTPGSRAEAEALVGAARILVVEDEGSYQDALLVGLTREGYQVEVAADGVTAMQRFIDHPPDLVLLDLLLPGMSGLEVCRRMRAVAPTPIIIVSALNTETDVVLAFELGAEDYISKPYRLRELVARIRSVLRRMALSSQEPPPGVIAPTTGPDAIAAGPFQVNFARRVVTAQGDPIHLSRREFDLLALLLSPPGRVRTRDELIDKLWAGRDLADTRTLDTHVRRLRLKLEMDPAHPQFLLTVRGVGFRFELGVDEASQGAPPTPDER